VKLKAFQGILTGLGLLIAAGCGEVGGAGQCNGVDVTGLCVTIDSIVPGTETEDTPDVDAFFNTDCNGDGVSDDPEVFTKHDADVTVSATLMPGVESPPAPAFVTFQSYTITYQASPTNQVTAPALSGHVFGGSEFKVNADQTFTTTLEMVPIQTKNQYVDNGGSGVPAIYTATYTLVGTTQFNEDIVLAGTASFNIGSFNTCQ
jgi:hypothetical protein